MKRFVLYTLNLISSEPKSDNENSLMFDEIELLDEEDDLSLLGYLIVKKINGYVFDTLLLKPIYYVFDGNVYEDRLL